MEQRKCKGCGKWKDIIEFPINNTLPSGVLRKHTCNTCRGHQSRVRSKLHRENKKPDLLVCPICRREIDLVLDHNHLTDEFRGWLCNDCNNGVGKFNDDIRLLQRAIDYLNGCLDKEDTFLTEL